MTEALPSWQQEPWRRLTGAWQQGRPPQALLLAGPAGLGKSRLAERLAAWLLCQHRDGEHACGRCHSCTLSAAGTHPDSALLTPPEDKKQILVDNARAATALLDRTAALGGWRVLRIEPAEAMNTSTANALLKRLEEPGPETVLILVSNAPGRLLPTIRSRCQRISLAAPGTEAAATWLQQQGVPAGEAAPALEAAGGLPRIALALWQDGALDERREWGETLRALASGEMSPVDAAAGWQRAQPEQLLEWLQSAAQRDLRASLTSPESVDYFRRNPDPAALARLCDGLRREWSLLRGTANPNPQLLLEAVAIACCETGHRAA